MSKQLFKSIFSACLIVLALSLALVMGVLSEYFSTQYNNQTKKATSYIAKAVEDEGMDYLKNLPVQEDQRITLIDKDGVVLFDNTQDITKMENHKDRQEVSSALENGTGEGTRYSSTLSKRTYYYAIKLSDGGVLRLATTQNAPWTLVFSMLQPIFIVLLVAVITSAVIASEISKKIVKPINNVDLDDDNISFCYEELTPFAERIKAQNKQISKQMEKLKNEQDERENMRKEFTANVSHELKTPLTSISGFAEIIMNGIAKPEDTRRFAGNIYDEAQRLTLMVGDIIKLSQLDEEGVEIECEDIDLYEASLSVKDILSSFAKKRGVNVKVTGEHSVINGVSQIVDEIIYNLVDNAIKYNVENGEVEIKIKDGIESATLTVSDTGIGIEKNEIDRIFERFYRVNKSHSKDDVDGTGLGLSIVKHGAAFLGASINIESEPKKGTKISLTIKK